MDFYLTLDYELFLGQKTGTVENCIIKPILELDKLASYFGLRLVIFVDAAYLLRLWELSNTIIGLKSELLLLIDNIQYLVTKGHDVQLHFHPQWIYSNYEVGEMQWIMDEVHYKLSDVELSVVEDYFKKSKALLDKIVGYKTRAFRAGGFCLDSFSDYTDLFWETGIRIDSSVARYKFVSSKVHYYDYRKIPQKQIYHFSNNIKNEDVNGRFLELSVSGYKWSHFAFFTNIRRVRNSYKATYRYGDGIGIKDRNNDFLRKVRKFFNPISTLACIDGGDVLLLERCLHRSKELKCQEMVVIGHPKFVSYESLKVLDAFLKNNRDSLNFMTTSDLLNKETI